MLFWIRISQWIKTSVPNINTHILIFIKRFIWAQTYLEATKMSETFYFFFLQTYSANFSSGSKIDIQIHIYFSFRRNNIEVECFRYLSRWHKPCQRLPSGRHFIFLVCTVWMMCGSGYGFISDSINFYQFTYHSILHLRFYFCFALLLCIWTEDNFFSLSLSYLCFSVLLARHGGRRD